MRTGTVRIGYATASSSGANSAGSIDLIPESSLSSKHNNRKDEQPHLINLQATTYFTNAQGVITFDKNSIKMRRRRARPHAQ